MAVGGGRGPSRAVAAAGWALGALVVALALSIAMNILFVDVLDAAIDPLVGGGVVPKWIQVVGSALVVGAAIGGVIGSRVGRFATVVAAGVTIFYVMAWPFAAFAVRGWVSGVSLGLHLAGAVLTAGWMRRRAELA